MYVKCITMYLVIERLDFHGYINRRFQILCLGKLEVDFDRC